MWNPGCSETCNPPASVPEGLILQMFRMPGWWSKSYYLFIRASSICSLDLWFTSDCFYLVYVIRAKKFFFVTNILVKLIKDCSISYWNLKSVIKSSSFPLSFSLGLSPSVFLPLCIPLNSHVLDNALSWIFNPSLSQVVTWLARLR